MISFDLVSVMIHIKKYSKQLGEIIQFIHFFAAHSTSVNDTVKINYKRMKEREKLNLILFSMLFMDVYHSHAYDDEKNV